MIKRLVAITFIFGCTAIAWFILGSTIFARTENLSGSLKEKVSDTWGKPQSQLAPFATWQRETIQTVEEEKGGKTTTREVRTYDAIPIPLESSKIQVRLDLDPRQKGLLWYSTYAVRFQGDYQFRNDSGADQDVTFHVDLPASEAIYDGLGVRSGGQPVPFFVKDNAMQATVHVRAGETVDFTSSYKSQGMTDWRYRFGNGVSQVKDFTLDMQTNFSDIDFPSSSLSPTSKQANAEGWRLVWKYDNMLSGFQIGMTMPEKLQPGPLAGQISFFAPVSLFFFFFLMMVLTTLRGIRLHPMHYFFLAGAFFAFHLLLAYLVDHISIHLAFGICSAVSIFLVISYLRLVVGARFAAVEAGIAQFLYLVLFSYAFFFKGFTGLAVTIGSILTLFVVMQMTGKVDWEKKFS